MRVAHVARVARALTRRGRAASTLSDVELQRDAIADPVATFDERLGRVDSIVSLA